MRSRRDFLATSAAAGVGLGLGGIPEHGPHPGAGASGPGTAAGPGQQVERAAKPLRLLFLGGTGFLGPAEVEYALARGHSVTLFNRGRTNPQLFPGAEKLQGDRAAPDYSALQGREWDAVLDTSASIATWVRDASRVLEGSIGRYLFVSSLSAHTDNSILGQKEDGAVFSRADYEKVVAENTGGGAAYGPNKAEAERIVHETFGDRGLVVRPGLIVGPGDNSDRFTYWPVRIDRGGEVVAPGDGTVGAQIVDVRDLGRFHIDLVEKEASGTYNAVGPLSPMSMAEMIYGIRAVTSAAVRITWVAADFLREQKVGAWMEMPVWVYPDEENRGFMEWDCSKAIAAGLTFRPLADTARDTLAWFKAKPEDARRLRTGLAPEKEAAILAAWHARNG
ncbi:MAG: twin-arginine translocation signal domain-containing protein [Longimicrobiales bacterium]|nr:twin-arginine translocation signal domain-containing protein [Longimicrobiales bacterium]